jgi:beta-glucosidase
MNRRRLLQTGAAGVAATALPRPVSAAQPVKFPPGFLWGTATSSYQVEGRGDRKADSIWDTFCRLPGTIHDRSNGDVADDSCHRYAEDIALIAGAGLKAYRFSVSWPRVMPDGTGQPDPKGLDYYSRVVDTALKAGIEPWVCLYHWDLPQALQDKGGWDNRQIADWFSDYAHLMAGRLGDRVTRWVMLNEPSVVAVIGNGCGEHAPGFKSRDRMFAAVHHQNLAQGRALATLRAAGGRRFKLGTVLSLQPVRPSDNSEADRRAAEMWDALWNRAFLNPLFQGRYPALIEPYVAPLMQPDDLKQIRQPVDYLGVNYYSPMYQRADTGGLVGTNWGALPPGTKTTAMGWPIDPGALYELLLDLHGNYGNPTLYITENGACFADHPGPGGRIDDEERIIFLHDHILACRKAISAGVDLRGYFAWSILDNFEWAWGYTRPFGLVAVDRATLKRTPKASYAWFSRVARANAA